MNSNSETKSLIENISNYIDTHLMEIRLSIGALGLVGVGIALRSIRLANKFYDNNQIPKSFVKKNIRLHGIVKSISTDGTINVDHLPIISMPWHPKVNDKHLNLSLAAINPTISGTYWLKLNVENKMVWFQIVWRNDNELNCIVSQIPAKRSFISKSLNTELLSRGLAFVKPFDERFNSINLYKNLYKTLNSVEKKAKKNNVGVWYKPTKWQTIKLQIHNYFLSIKKLLNLRNV